MANVPTAATPSQTAAQQQAELEWIQMRADYADIHAETTREKMARKLHENPLVPVGCGATLLALGFGLWNFRQGKTQMSQYMMRARILAQGFTVVALIVGVGMTYAKKNKE
ncbi:HIG1 domain family member 2A, mitochondrial [Topomyia yanbarensis]|uniref:HIG1 domain family member 2A, mitochondrial n=1 Tax=Topomyia yanbarensis TaxID=2498891 RepID=UPI00273A8CEC|nr:HIG1 domain family member 2A, mitochondrial [Topomyia yanbarensis]